MKGTGKCTKVVPINVHTKSLVNSFELITKFIKNQSTVYTLRSRKLKLSSVTFSQVSLREFEDLESGGGSSKNGGQRFLPK